MRLGLLGGLICLLVGCEKVGSTDENNPAPKDAVRLLFTYSSEKEDWVKDVTATFNQGGYKTRAGKLIYVDAVAGYFDVLLGVQGEEPGARIQEQGGAGGVSGVSAKRRMDDAAIGRC